MAKEALSKPVVAAVESVLQQFMPQITERLDGLQAQISELHRDVDDLRRDMDEKFKHVDARFEQAKEGVNELGIRINTVGTRLDAFTEMIQFESNRRDSLLERIVRLEMTVEPKPGTRKKRAG